MVVELTRSHPRLVSVNVGLPRNIDWHGQTVYTGIWKMPVSGRSVVRRLNIEGDAQGDLGGHGGEQRAVMVYQLDSYRYWQHQLGRNDFTYGQFGENFTIEGLTDEEVCIGDRYRIGTALFEVTQPRVTCYRVGIRMNEPRLPSLLVSHHRPGFYFRVLEEGEIGAGDEIFKVSDGPEHVTVAEVDALLYLPGRRRDQLERALKIPALSPGWKGSLQALLSQESETPGAGNAGLTDTTAPPAWTGFRPLRVARVEKESEDILSFSFESRNGSALPAALPGQFLVLKLHPKLNAAPLLRNYSLSGRPGADTYRVSVKQEVNGAGSLFLHNHVAAGDIIEVSAPRGTFLLRPVLRPVVLLSVGVGATPLLAMLHALASAEAATIEEIWWLYGARNHKNHPFSQESRALLSALPNVRSYVAYSQPEPDDRLGEHYDGPGHVGMPLLQRLGAPRDADFYLCGPPPFLTEFAAGLKNWSVPGSQIHSETFGPGESLKPGIVKVAKTPVHTPAGALGTGPSVAFARSGLTVPWSDRYGSLLELAEACDVPAKWSCRTGVCHTCECGLIGGDVEYEPEPLEPPARGNLLICCSRPRGEIQLDL